MTVEIITFGYLHAPPPEAHITLDLRHHFRDPHVNPELRHLTAEDEAVMRAVLSTPGIRSLIASTASIVHAYRQGPTQSAITVAIGCAGGRHRSAAAGAELARVMQACGVPVSLTHRDLDKPVVARSA